MGVLYLNRTIKNNNHKRYIPWDVWYVAEVWQEEIYVWKTDYKYDVNVLM